MSNTGDGKMKIEVLIRLGLEFGISFLAILILGFFCLTNFFIFVGSQDILLSGLLLIFLCLPTIIAAARASTSASKENFEKYLNLFSWELHGRNDL